MVSKMVREKVTTNDVRNFVRKQSNMKRTSKGINLKVTKLQSKKEEERVERDAKKRFQLPRSEMQKLN